MQRLILAVRFYAGIAGREPVRRFLLTLPVESRKAVGADIKTVQLGWPMGMPLVRKMEPGIWEVRSRVDGGIVRILFTVDNDRMVLLHGFIKKGSKTPVNELATARRRLRKLREVAE